MKKRIKAITCTVLSALLVSTAFSGFATKKVANQATSAPYTVKLAYLTIYGNPKDQAKVEAAINKISVKKANVKIQLEPIAYAQWTQQMNLILASSEKLDLTVILPGYYNTYVAQGKLQSMDSLLKTYGKGIIQAYDNLSPSFLDACKVGGKTYGVAQLREFGSSWGICIRKDVASAVGMKAGTKLTLATAEKYLLAIKKQYPSMTPIMPQVGGSTASMITNLRSWDQLSDGLGVLLNGGRNPKLKVEDLYETAFYKNLVTSMRRWYQEGLIAKDASTTNDSAVTRIKAGSVAAMMSNMKPGFDVQEQGLTGKVMEDFDIVSPLSSTSDVASFLYGIPVNCKNPVAAMKMLNLLYTDKDIMNLMCWGIEGTDYVKTSTPNVIDYPKGVTSSSVQWSQGLAWQMGNEFISYVMKPNSKTIWQDTIKFDKTMTTSKAMGFSFDESSVKTQVTAVTNVKNEYASSLEDGAVDPSSVLPQFISALNSNGMGTILKEKQNQLNKWLKANGKSALIP